jgi:hypothetical protein
MKDAKMVKTAEAIRLEENAARKKYWKRWGPYLAERQWGTVREDYSADQEPWEYFTHDHARSRAYRWGEDGLLGISDSKGRLCFALALWNGHDPILKERLYGLSGKEGNHGEDVKECYYYLDSTPTHSYMKALYKYPQEEFPYTRLLEENRRRGREQPEFELPDTGIFDDSRYFDVFAEYAKNQPNDILIRLTVANRAEQSAAIHILPTLWFRNTWSWGRSGEGYGPKPRLYLSEEACLCAEHDMLGRYFLSADTASNGTAPDHLFTENETNTQRIFNIPLPKPYVKDAFHRYVIHHEENAVNPERNGTKAAAYYRLEIPAGQNISIRLRLYAEREAPQRIFGSSFDAVFRKRLEETVLYYADLAPEGMSAEEHNILRQGYAGLFWTKQFYHYAAAEWLEGDPAQPGPSDGRTSGRNHEWTHLYNRDVISMPDKWEYPWYAAWDLAFHMIAAAKADPYFAKEQLVLLLREWYMHPNGQLPAYEWTFSDVNPPVHAWAAWRIYKITGSRGRRDRTFLARVFQKLLLNFTWWVNRKDPHGLNIFSGGFLGMDNIGVFDRSKPLPTGGHLEQADGTAWMAFYCSTMLAISFELAREDPVYEDMASKFFEHYMAIADAVNSLDGYGLWDEDDGFYYDHIHTDSTFMPLKVRSLVGLLPLIAVEVLEDEVIDRLPGFKARMNWFLEQRGDLASSITCMRCSDDTGEQDHRHRILAIPTRDRLLRILEYLFDVEEFLSPFGIRSLSRFYEKHPYVFRADGREYRIDYTPGESNTYLFGGNSNWRGPIWFPVNYLIIEALERYHHFYGDDLQVDFPTGSGNSMNLGQAAEQLSRRLCSIFIPDEEGRRTCHGDEKRCAGDPHWKDLVLFHEYFNAETGAGLGASHQTGWTALVLKLMEDLAVHR